MSIEERASAGTAGSERGAGLDGRGGEAAEQGSLAGIRVVDFTRILAGPLATMVLGDLGAEVVKVERPGTGDDTRSWGPPFDPSGTATYFLAVNRNKVGEVIDLAGEDGRRRALELVASADVVVENFRPGVMDRLGLGWDALHAHHPGLVYCSISAFGTEAGAELAGYDLIVQAVGGLMSITGDPDGEPQKVGVALVDVVAGLFASVGIIAAIRHRDRTGEGQRVEVDLLSSLLAALTNQAAAFTAGGTIPQRLGNAHPSIAPYEVLDTRSGRLAVAVGNERQWAALCHTLAAGHLVDDPRFSTNERRVARRVPLRAALTSALAAADAGTWAARLNAAGVPAGGVNDIGAAFALARDLGLEPTVALGGEGSRVARNPIRMSATPPTYRLPPPVLGP